MMEILALCAPWILLIHIIAAVVLMLFKKWKVASVLFILAVIGNWHFRCVPINICCTTSDDGEVLKVMSFNCNLSPRHEGDYYSAVTQVAKIIEQEDADVVFLTENFGIEYDSVYRYVQHIYPHRLNWKRLKNSTGNTIYSRFPIVADTTFKAKEYPYTITQVSIEYGTQIVDILGVHLSSNNYNEHMEYMTPDSIEGHEQARTYLGNILKAGVHRQEEARQIVDFISKSNNPTIVMGDFNDVCGSPTLNILERAGLKDAWWEGGFGYGATIHKPLPYRIDHIMYNDGLKLKSIRKIDAQGLSDHDALMAEFRLAN